MIRIARCRARCWGWCLLAIGASLRAETVVRAQVEPETAWVGQRVELKIEVLSDQGWAQAARFGDVDLEGAYLLGPSGQGTRLSQSIDGSDYAGQGYALSIYPQAEGRLAIPAIPIDVSVRTYGADAGERMERHETPATTIMVKTPPGAEGVTGLISTTALSVSQEWKTLPAEPKVGDALTRVVSFEAEGISGMAFTPLAFPAPAGVGVYPAEPLVEDRGNRGTLTGSRTESVTYVLERPGEVEIPAIPYGWWNLGDERLEQMELPGRTLEVAPAATGSAADSGAPSRRPDWRGVAAALVLIGLLVTLLARYRESLHGRWLAWRTRRREREQRYFRSASAAIRGGERRAALAAVMRWLDRIHTGARPARLGDFLDRYAQTPARERLLVLLTDSDLRTALPSPKRLACDLADCRRQWRAESRAGKREAGRLPPLNQPAQSD